MGLKKLEEKNLQTSCIHFSKEEKWRYFRVEKRGYYNQFRIFASFLSIEHANDIAFPSSEMPATAPHASIRSFVDENKSFYNVYEVKLDYNRFDIDQRPRKCQCK